MANESTNILKSKRCGISLNLTKAPKLQQILYMLCTYVRTAVLWQLGNLQTNQIAVFAFWVIVMPHSNIPLLPWTPLSRPLSCDSNVSHTTLILCISNVYLCIYTLYAIYLPALYGSVSACLCDPSPRSTGYRQLNLNHLPWTRSVCSVSSVSKSSKSEWC